MTTFDEPEAYELFLILDTLARIREGEDETVNYFRERLLPVYRNWHKANPHTCRAPLPITSLEQS